MGSFDQLPPQNSDEPNHVQPPSTSIDEIIEMPSEADLSTLLEIGNKGPIGYEWEMVIEGLQGGFITSGCARQRLFELTHICSIDEIHGSEEDKKQVERILRQKLASPELHLRENIILLLARDTYNLALASDHESAKRLFSHYSSWGHAMNQGPLSVGLRTITPIIVGFPEIFGHPPESELVANLKQIEMTLLPAEFCDGSREIGQSGDQILAYVTKDETHGDYNKYITLKKKLDYKKKLGNT